MNQNHISDNYHLLLSKLDQFIRKFYKNRMLKGAILFGSIFLGTFLLASFLEAIGHFGTMTRTIIFYLYLFLNVIVLIWFVMIPLFKLFRIGKIISHEEAAQIIGKHFSEVKDKLLNTLDLHKQFELENDPLTRQFIESSIQQRTIMLRPVPFNLAVRFSENRQYLKYLLIPLFLLLVYSISTPGLLSQSTFRLLKHNQYFERPLPFEFEILNKSLTGIKNEDFILKVRLKGEALPDKLSISTNGKEYLMDRIRQNTFEFTFRNLSQKLSFRFFTGNLYSRPYEINVIPKPLLVKLKIKLDFPPYLGKVAEEFENSGDLTIPEGTRVTWSFEVLESEKLSVSFEDTSIFASRKDDNMFELRRSFRKNNSYAISTSNKYMRNSDSINYIISIIPDAHPNVAVNTEKDSFGSKYFFFNGEVTDDYGISRLTFNYRFLNSSDSTRNKKLYRIPVTLPAGKNNIEFYYSFDFNSLNIGAGEELEYYFEVWDNDGVNGPKSATSQRFYFKSLSEKEVDMKTEKLSETIKTELEKTAKKTKDLQNDIQEARKKLLENKDLKWEDKKFIEDILKRQEDLKKDIEDIKKDFIENAVTKDENKGIDKEILEKYEKLYKMFDELIPDDIKSMYEELNKLLENNMKDKIQDELQKMNKNNTDINKDLDRMLELFKKLQFEEKMDDISDKLDKLSEEQDKLSRETDDKNSNKSDLEKKQKDLNDRFEDLKEDFKKLEELNKELEKPHDLEDTKDMQDKIQDQMEEGLENLQMNKKGNASKNQKNAASQMKDLARKMREMKSGMEMEELEINTAKLRQILENLIYLSFEEEKLMNELKTINTSNPRYVSLAQQQKKLKEDARMIEDSLFALSKEIPQIESYINKDMTSIRMNLERTVELLSDRQVNDARAKQQMVMTSVNNVAVLLSEILKDMQQDMNMMASGNKSGKKKKTGEGIGDIRKLQEQLSKQIQDLKSGKMPGQNMSKELARLAAQQEYLREMLRRLNQEQNKNGTKPYGDLDAIEKLMMENEKDLVNKNITTKTLDRQKEITIKLLEAEKADRTQDQEEKRESRTARDIFLPKPPSLEEYKKLKLKEVEIIQAVPPSLNPYFKAKVKDYFKELPSR